MILELHGLRHEATDLEFIMQLSCKTKAEQSICNGRIDAASHLLNPSCKKQKFEERYLAGIPSKGIRTLDTIYQVYHEGHISWLQLIVPNANFSDLFVAGFHYLYWWTLITKADIYIFTQKPKLDDRQALWITQLQEKK